MNGLIGYIRYSAYERAVRQILDAEKAVYIYISAFFRCKQAPGCRAALCVCAEQGKAWIMPDEKRMRKTTDRKKKKAILHSFAEFGIRSCSCMDDLMSILQELGRDAVKRAFSQDEKQAIFSIMYFGGDPA